LNTINNYVKAFLLSKIKLSYSVFFSYFNPTLTVYEGITGES